MTIASLLTDGANPLAFSVSSLGGSSGYNFDFTNPNNTFSGGVNISNASARDDRLKQQFVDLHGDGHDHDQQ